MKYIKRLLLVIVAALVVATPVMASDISAALFKGTLTIVNDNSSALPNISVPFTLDTDNMIAAGYLDADAGDAAIQAAGVDLPFMPAPPGDNAWMIFKSLVAPGNTSAYLYNNSTGGKIRYFPDSAGMATVDSATLEPGDDFQIEQEGFLDVTAGAGKYLIYKEHAVEAYVDDGTSGDIVADIYQEYTDSLYLLPNGAGDYTGIANVNGAATHWEAVDDPVATPDDAATFVWTDAALGEKDVYAIENPSWEGVGQEVTAVTIYTRTNSNFAGGHTYPIVRLSGVDVNGTNVALVNGVYTTVGEVLTRPGGGDWDIADIDSIQAGLYLEGNGPGNMGRCTQVYVKVDYIYYQIDVSVTASGITSGEKKVTVGTFDRPDIDDYSTGAEVAVNTGAGILPCRVLQEKTLAAPAASVTFSDIDDLVTAWNTISGTTSRHLVLIVNAAGTDAFNTADVYVTLNGTGSSIQRLYGAGAGAAADVAGNMMFQVPAAAYGANVFGGGVSIIPHAFNTTNHKSFISLSGAVEQYIFAVTGRFAVTSATTTIVFTISSGNFATGSTIQLAVVDERYLVEEEILAADGTIQFTGIPQTGNDLTIIGVGRSGHNTYDNLLMGVNADAVAGNYARQTLQGSTVATTASQGNDLRVGALCGDDNPTLLSPFIISISQYAETTNNPHYIAISGRDNTVIQLTSARHINVAAITSVELFSELDAANELASGFIASLYRVPQYLIQRYELTAPAASVTFSDIPQNYEAIQLLVYARTDSVLANWDSVTFQMNADAVAANYDRQVLYGVGAVVGAAQGAANRDWMHVATNALGANQFSCGVITFPQYSATDRHKHGIAISGSVENIVTLTSTRWESTAAIVSITLDQNDGTVFNTGSIFELVGVMPIVEFGIQIDDVIEASSDFGGIEVADNDNDWSFLENWAMPYMEYQNITISNVSQQEIEWEYDTTFTDGSGQSHDATPTFRSTTSDADVSCSLTAFVPIEQAQASPDFDPFSTLNLTAPDEIDALYTEGDTSGIPGAEVVNDILDASDVPQDLFWIPVVFVIAILIGFGVYSWTGEIWVMGAAIAFTLAGVSYNTNNGVDITGGIIPFWTVIAAIIITLSIALVEHRDIVS